MNIIYAGFPGLGFQVKNLCVMFVFAIVSFLFFSEYQFAVDIVQGYNLHVKRENNHEDIHIGSMSHNQRRIYGNKRCTNLSSTSTNVI
jgi:hypothetical protein